MNAWKVTVLLLCGCLFISYVFYDNKEKEIKILQDGYVRLLFLLLLVFLCSCKEKTKEVVKHDSVSILIPTSKQIAGTQIPIDIVLDPARLHIGEDLLFVSCFKCDTMIYTFSLPDFKLLSSFGRKGNGPEDLLFPTFTQAKKDTVGVWGYPDFKKIKQFKVSKTGEWSLIHEYQLPHNKAYNQLYMVDDSFAYYNDYPPLLTLRKINLHNKNEREYSFEMDQPSGGVFFMKNKGNLSVTNNGIAYLYYYKNRVDFFDSDFNFLKSYVGSHDKISIDDKNMKESIVYYLNSFAGEKCLYAINHAQAYKYKKEHACTLDIFDWSGQLNKSVELNPAVDIFVVDEKRQVIYGYNYNHPDCFYRYNIE